VFADPETVDIGRTPNRHLAFATGIHVCLGATLARIEGRIAIGQLVRRFPKLDLAGVPRRVPLARFRGWAELPIRVG
jgi:cytochrome P450